MSLLTPWIGAICASAVNIVSAAEGKGPPEARARLVSINEKIAIAQTALQRLNEGKARLECELAKASEAEAERNDLVANEANDLASAISAGSQWMLSAFGSRKLRDLSAALSASKTEASIGEAALARVSEQIAQTERSLSDLRAQKQDAMAAVLREASRGWLLDLRSLEDDLRQVLTILTALDRLTAKSTGEWSPSDRPVAVIPACAGFPERAVVAPTAAIDRAHRILADYAKRLETDPLADIEAVEFPRVTDNEPSNTIYSDLSRPERIAIDQARAQGV